MREEALKPSVKCEVSREDCLVTVLQQSWYPRVELLEKSIIAELRTQRS